MRIPSIEQCFSFMQDFGMYENIRQHSMMVARVADALHRGLERTRKGDLLPPHNAVVAGALLHDIAKARCLEENCKHAEVGEAICQELGYPEVAEMVGNHVILARYSSDLYTEGIFGAVELVYYADKRVKHDKIVTLEERLEYILDKYSQSDTVRESMIRKNFKKCRDLENYLFACLDFDPDELALQINAHLFLQPIHSHA